MSSNCGTDSTLVELAFFVVDDFTAVVLGLAVVLDVDFVDLDVDLAVVVLGFGKTSGLRVIVLKAMGVGVVVHFHVPSVSSAKLFPSSESSY